MRSPLRIGVQLLQGVAVAGLFALGPTAAGAESISEALALAYANNPTINAQRAATRAVDENIPIAKSALRPQVSGNADIGKSWTETNIGLNAGRTITLQPGGFGVTISQALFDGFKTRNNVEAARAAIYASRETLRNTEQNVLFDGASAYVDVIRDQAVAAYRAQSLEFLNEQVRSERARFQVGESTRTDVAQAEAQQAAAVAQLNGARAQLQSSMAVYRQIIGKDPQKLKNPAGVGKLVPSQLQRALDIGFAEHPAILATKYLVDQADWNVKSSESDLLPRVTLDGAVNRRFDSSVNGQVTNAAQITARLTVPIYQGGRVSAQVRQNKETLGQRWIEVDQAVDNVRAAIVAAFSQLEAAKASLVANDTQLRAAQLALQGAVEERNVGQRTTLDVLNTQQQVITAQISAAASRRDVIVAGYALLSAIGRLNAGQLNLAVAKYEPEEHFTAVVDKWYGLRTPDGR
ncbi:MAG: TolC family outer membrane protein [Rhizobiaceae bacterium]